MSRSTAGSSEERTVRGDVGHREQRARNTGGVATPKVSTNPGARRKRGQSARRETLEVGGSNPSPRARRRPFIEWRNPLGLPECPYAYRWLVDPRMFSVRLHHWIGNDDLRAPHDHPWSFITVIIAGSYTDVQPDDEDVLRQGSIRWRPMLHRHSVKLNTPSVWSLVITGPHRRPFCFWPNGKRVKANKWFFANGKHPCQ